MFHETDVIVPMFMAGDPGEAIRAARADTSVFQIKAEKSRDRVAKEILKRYKALPGSFWEWYLSLAEGPRRVALFYVLLKTYRLLFEFQVNLAIPKYNSPDRVLTKNDVQAALSEIASRDEFVDSWSGETRDRLSSQYLAMLRQGGFVDSATGELCPPAIGDDDYAEYVRRGEVWFLQACFLPGYRIEQIKQLAL
jgi:hypothetical protein